MLTINPDLGFLENILRKTNLKTSPGSFIGYRFGGLKLDLIRVKKRNMFGNRSFQD